MKNFDINKFKQNLKTDYMGKNLIYLKKIDSTNSYASVLEKSLLKADIKDKSILKINQLKDNIKNIQDQASAIDRTVILSEIQTSGRGRFNKRWISPPGGLWFTVIILSQFEEKDLPKITFIAGASIAETLKEDYGIEVNIKWPNDIYYRKSKLGGILSESEIIGKNIFINIGIGINVNVDKKNLSLHNLNATSIKYIKGKEIEREILLSKILYNFEKKYKYYENTRDFNKIFRKVEDFLIY